MFRNNKNQRDGSGYSCHQDTSSTGVIDSQSNNQHYEKRSKNLINIIDDQHQNKSRAIQDKTSINGLQFFEDKSCSI